MLTHKHTSHEHPRWREAHASLFHQLCLSLWIVLSLGGVVLLMGASHLLGLALHAAMGE
jgi:hypothetical protein